MTLAVGLGVFGVCCSLVGLACVGGDWWLQHRKSPGRHRYDPSMEGRFSATENLRVLRADTDRLPAIPHPTREQLRAPAAHQ